MHQSPSLARAKKIRREAGYEEGNLKVREARIYDSTDKEKFITD